MHPNSIYLASDNYSPAHPTILQAIQKANQDYAHSYGSDPWTEEATQLLCEAFGHPAKILFLPTGTGSNVLALKLALKPHESVLCTEIAHINTQESGSAEAIVGCKLLPLPHQNGKLTPQDVRKKLNAERPLGKHTTSPRLLSITQPTEVGTVYTLAELKALSSLCKEENLLLHIDGSRLYNSLVALSCSFKEIVEAAKPDLLSLGGTKNGLLFAESLLIFHPPLQDGADYLQKQTLQLLSKMRFLSAQYIPFFKEKLWHTLASHANRQAGRIGSLIASIPELTLNYPVETNQIFFSAPADWLPRIQKQIVCYPWNMEKNELRLVTSWNTSDQEIEQFIQAINSSRY